MPNPPEFDQTSHSERDAASLRILGFFFAVLGALVLIGTLWSLGNFRAVVVNVSSGAVLLAVGLGMLAFTRRASSKTDNRE
ncbi:MAG: hypothetical protein GXP24_11475 [Planctomycetes bacterium]|nr:hypothetical protein [Planctomycetota bacterium]